MNLKLLKQRVADCYDVDVLVDVLQITSEELLDAFEAYLIAAYDNGEFPNMGDE